MVDRNSHRDQDTLTIGMDAATLHPDPIIGARAARAAVDPIGWADDLLRRLCEMRAELEMVQLPESEHVDARDISSILNHMSELISGVLDVHNNTLIDMYEGRMPQPVESLPYKEEESRHDDHQPAADRDPIAKCNELVRLFNDVRAELGTVKLPASWTIDQREKAILKAFASSLESVFLDYLNNRIVAIYEGKLDPANMIPTPSQEGGE